MYTPEEKAQLERIKSMGFTEITETNIKEVVGGYMILHVINYMDGDTIQGQTRHQFVTADPAGVREAIEGLYADSEFEPGHDYRPQIEAIQQQQLAGEGLAKVPEQERSFGKKKKD